MSTLSAPTPLSSYIGLSADDGAEISGDAHLRQSIRDILTTPLGSRVMRRNYGSRIFQLLDSPMTQGLVADIVAASAEAIIEWEPRVTLKQVIVGDVSPGQFSLDLVVEDGDGNVATLQGVI